MQQRIKILEFSTHDLSWRSTVQSLHSKQRLFNFQLTTSRGGRRIATTISILHNLFNSRPLGEVDLISISGTVPHSFFNSRPLGEVDPPARVKVNPGTFSTHDLSGRSTGVFSVLFLLYRFSTHDLSGRSTIVVLYGTDGKGFSTHDLSGRSTAKLHNKSLKFCIFSGHFILEQMSLPFSYKYH